MKGNEKKSKSLEYVSSCEIMSLRYRRTNTYQVLSVAFNSSLDGIMDMFSCLSAAFHNIT